MPQQSIPLVNGFTNRYNGRRNKTKVHRIAYAVNLRIADILHLVSVVTVSISQLTTPQQRVTCTNQEVLSRCIRCSKNLEIKGVTDTVNIRIKLLQHLFLRATGSQLIAAPQEGLPNTDYGILVNSRNLSPNLSRTDKCA